MKIKGSKKSHIQIPKSILNGFVQPKQKPLKVYKMNLDGIITEEDIKKVNTEDGYYEDEIEEQLSKIEARFGEVKKRILQFDKNGGMRLAPEDILITIEYCKLCFVRSPKFRDDFEKNLKWSNILNHAPQNLVLHMYINCPEIIDEYFIKYTNFSIAINRTNSNLILPQSGFIQIINEAVGEDSLYMPISPKYAIVLTNQKTISGNTFYIKIFDEDNLDKLNREAIFAEFKYNRGAIYAKEKKDLEKYSGYAKMIKLKLENNI